MDMAGKYALMIVVVLAVVIAGTLAFCVIVWPERTCGFLALFSGWP